jgi:predicted amidohydrolase
MRNKKLTRRGFLGTAAGVGLGSLALPAFPVKLAAESGTVLESNLGQHDGNALSSGTNGGCADRAEDWRSTSNQPPRKVIVGTVMQPFWGKYPGLEKRLQLLTELVDRLQEQSQKQYGHGLDLAVLPEMAVTGEGESVGDVVEWSFPLEGPVQEAFAEKARQHHCYIVVPLFLLEDKATKLCSNAAVLIGRQGEVAGIYRKVHLVVDERTDSMEHGCTPGKEEPIFVCDFGKLGIQICYDIDFNYGWRELARKGAEIVAWPTQSPQRARPVARAIEGHYYIISSTWRTDACVFEPTGKIVSQIEWKPSMGAANGWSQNVDGRLLENNILVQEIDLSYAILPYSRTLKNGELFTKTFGDRAGFRYYEDDDRGIFWSNDPKMTVRQMIDSLGQTEEQEELQHDRGVYHKAGVPGY